MITSLYPMQVLSHSLEVRTKGKALYPITHEIASWIHQTGAKNGLLTVFVQHTSASLVIQENADPDVMLDMADFFERLVPESDSDALQALYRHTIEGPDDMPAHIRGALTQTSLSIPVMGGCMALGVWQGIYLFEHRSAPKQRRILLQLLAS